MINIKDCKGGYILKGKENHKVKIVDGHNKCGYFIIYYGSHYLIQLHRMLV